MMSRLLGVSVLISLSVPAGLLAQHDAHRNAVRHIAAGRLKRASDELKKAAPDAPETHYVRMLHSLSQGGVARAIGHARAGLDAGLPFERLVAGPRETLAPLYKATAWKEWSKRHKSPRLLHGPMLGNVTHDSASFWMRTAKTAAVQVKVFTVDSKQLVSSSPSKRSNAASDFTAVVRTAGLSPSTEYRYQVLVDGEPVRVESSRFTTFPAQGKSAAFRIGFGGAAGYVPKWESMWDTIVKVRPLAFFMLGDNVYIDDPQHRLTQRYCYYRRQSRPEWRRLVASTSMFAIYDDHDFGTNDCVPGPQIDNPAWKRAVWKTFRRNWVNPYYGGGEKQPGCWCDFYIGDVHFILLDGRYYRTRKGRPSMLGPVQKAWLLETVKTSRGTFKVLASPVPWTEGVKPGSRDPWDGYPEEREEIFSFLERQKINGVILISADRHRSDLRVTKRPNGYDLFEFESSRLTNRHTHRIVKTPGLIWGYNKTCSFGLIRFDTTQSDPRVRFEVVDIDGNRVHSYELRLGQLTHGKSE